jgi:RHS repeat-associated protein
VLRYVWHDGSIIQVLRNGKPQETWVFSHHDYSAVAKIREGQAYSVISDHLGTPRELVAQDGRVVWSAYFDAYGKSIKVDASEESCELRFPGQWHDPESGLHYNQFRYYDPEYGRYLSPDPIGIAGGLNEYAYSDNPVKWIDPLGLCKKIALGKDIAGRGMKALAQKTGASWWRNWEKDGITRRTVDRHFGRAFNQAVKRADEIHFSLDGIPNPKAAAQAGAAGFTRDNMTNAELNIVSKNPDLLAKTTFYRDGDPVDSPFD